MTFAKQKEIEQILGEVKSFEEFNRLARLQAIYIEEITSKLSTIWIINAKVDKLYKEIMEKKYGK